MRYCCSQILISLNLSYMYFAASVCTRIIYLKCCSNHLTISARYRFNGPASHSCTRLYNIGKYPIPKLPTLAAIQNTLDRNFFMRLSMVWVCRVHALLDTTRKESKVDTGLSSLDQPRPGARLLEHIEWVMSIFIPLFLPHLSYIKTSA